MIFEMRTYRLQPGSVPEVEKRFGEALTAKLSVGPEGQGSSILATRIWLPRFDQLWEARFERVRP